MKISSTPTSVVTNFQIVTFTSSENVKNDHFELVKFLPRWKFLVIQYMYSLIHIAGSLPSHWSNIVLFNHCMIYGSLYYIFSNIWLDIRKWKSHKSYIWPWAIAHRDLLAKQHPKVFLFVKCCVKIMKHSRQWGTLKKAQNMHFYIVYLLYQLFLLKNAHTKHTMYHKQVVQCVKKSQK